MGSQAGRLSYETVRKDSWSLFSQVWHGSHVPHRWWQGPRACG